MRHGEHNHVANVILLMELPLNAWNTHIHTNTHRGRQPHTHTQTHILSYDRGKSFDLSD